MKTTVTLLILLSLCTPTFAQNYTQINLPKGAKARIGKGRISGNIAYSPNGTRFAVASSIGIWLYDTTTYQEVALLTGHSDGVSSVAFSPDGSTLASGSDDNTIRLWNATNGNPIRTLEEHTRAVRSVAFSPDGSTLASGSDNTIRLWSATNGNPIRTLKHTGNVSSVAFSPDGSTLASAWGWDNTIRLWNATNGNPIRTLEEHTDYVSSVAFSPDGSTLASGSDDNTIRLWNATNGNPIRTLEGHWNSVSSVAFSPDGSTLASGSDNTIRLWNATNGNPIRTLEEHTDYVRSVAFSPDGSTLASGSNDNTIRLWNVTNGVLIHTITGYALAVDGVAFSPDSRTLVSAVHDHDDIRVWDIASGALIHTLGDYDRDALGVHRLYLSEIAFSPDGRTIASVSDDGIVFLWDLTPSTVSLVPFPVLSPAVGEKLTLSLNIANGENVAGYQATVQYDTSTLRYTESAKGDYLPTDAFFVPPVVEGNRVTLASSAIAAVSNGDGTLATITFEVVERKASIVTLSQVSLVDLDGTLSFPKIENGAVSELPQLGVDVNADGVVNIQDLVLVGANFGKTGENTADVNGDGVVNIVDLVKVAGVFGEAAAPPSVLPHVYARRWMSMLTVADVQGWLTQARALDLTDATVQRGIIVLEHLLSVLTPKETALLPNYPNPFNPETWIPYHLAHAADVTLTLYNIKGAVVQRFELGHQPAGFYTTRAQAAHWDGRNASGESVASGVYFYQLRADDYSALRRMVILK